MPIWRYPMLSANFGCAGFGMAGTLVQGALFTVMVVRAAMLRDDTFAGELAQQVERSPRFFENAPVVLDLKGADDFTTVEEFESANEVLRAHTLSLVGIQNAEPAQRRAATSAGLASFGPSSSQQARRPARAEPATIGVETTTVAAAPAAPLAATAEPPSARPPARLVTQPVRSGTQIYARGTDLVVTATVSPGAELVADGNIHVYGALRGRALAGASGDATARIFCSRLEAELVSIAGRYLVNEQLPPEQQGLPVQIALVDDQLTITRN
ncbi:MAG TPA: septum site-determining protein MinC [Stellaceae bacterium]|jgi:septum site-determining protein MinC|nr:septum site-determining protein MinC [Stellaceae bacterium]